MNKVFGHLGDKLPIYLLVLILGSLMLYYAFGYVPQNERRLDDHAIRILENKGLAIGDKYRGYDNAVNSAPLSYLSKWFFSLDPYADSLFVKDELKELRRIYFSSKSIPFLKRAISKRDLTKAPVDPHLVPRRRNPEDKRAVTRIWKEDRGTSHFVFTPEFLFVEANVNGNNVSWSEGISPLLLANIAEFTSNLKENDFFEDLFLIRADDCPDCKENPSIAETSGYGNFILDQSKLGLVEFILGDTSRNASSGIYQEKIFGKQYKVYYQKIKLRRGLDVYLVGLIPLNEFKSEAKKVSQWFLVFCSLGALLLIFSFPVLKLFLLSRGERLSTKDISRGVFSVMLCTCLCLVLSIGYYCFWGLETKRRNDDIQKLAQEIKKNASAEIDLFHQALLATKMSENGIDQNSFKSQIGDYEFNEVFYLELDRGSMLSMYNGTGQSRDLKLFPISVGERNYFKAIRDNPQLDYFLQSINSYPTGKSEVALSVPIETDSDKYVGVVTTPLRSILQAGVPSPYQFILLDDRGDVKFHSGWNQIKSENFLRELDDDRVFATQLKNGIADYVDFIYLRNDCIGYIVPVLKNWSVLVYYRRSEIHNMSAQIFIMCLISLFIVVIFCMVIHLILRIDRYKPILLKTTPFQYEWLNPNKFNRRTWWILFVINLSLLATESLGLWILSSTISILFFALLVIATAYFLNYSILSTKRLSLKSWNWALGWLMVTMILLMVCCLIIDFWKALILSGVLLTICFIVRKYVKPKNTDSPDLNAFDERDDMFFAYRFFMITWLLVIIIGPAIGLLIRHYRFEKTMATYASLIADVQKLREKASPEKPAPKGNLYYSFLANDAEEVKGDETDVNDFADSLYYNTLPNFATASEGHTRLPFNYVPVMSDLYISRYGNIFRVKASTNTLGTKVDEIERHTRLAGPELRLDRSVGVSTILIVGVLLLLWWVLTSLTRKIFFLPKHAAWDILPPQQGDWGKVKFEYSNIDQTLHLLHDQKLSMPDVPDNSQQWEHEKRIVELQRQEKNLYTKCWEDCSDEEKFFLFDLSEDGVVNRPDDELLRDLCEKKLLRVYPRLEIVNVSFANFVRTVMKKDEIEKMEREESKDGQWKQIRVLLIITIIAAFAFLSIAEENFFGRATALIGSITLILPNVLNLLGSMTKLFTKSTPSVNGP